MDEMTWNYRLVDMTAQNDGEPWLEIKEVYYKGDKPVGFANATVGDDAMDGIKTQLERMLRACDKPVLVADADDNLMEVKDEQGK
jgi:hypothetical protein